MSSYLQQHNQRLDARSRSIEGRDQPQSSYTRFLEDQIAKFSKRDADFEKMQAKIVDLQTKFDRLLNNDAKYDIESTARNKTTAKLEEKMASFEGLAERMDCAEKQMMQRYIAFEAKVNARLNKIEREIDQIPSRTREQWQIDLQEFGRYLDSSLRAETNQSPQTTAVKEKDKKKSGKSIRFKGQTSENSENISRYEMMREEFNVKLQSLIEEVQNTVTLKEFDKKCQHFEERIGLLKGLIPPAAAAAPVVQVVDPPATNNDATLKYMTRRLGFLEEGMNQLKTTIDNLFTLMHKEKVGKRSNLNYLNLEEDLTPINPTSSEIAKKTRPRHESYEAKNFLNIDDIENFDIFEGQLSHRSMTHYDEQHEMTSKQTQPRVKPYSTKVSSSTGKISLPPNKNPGITSSQNNPLGPAKYRPQQSREEGILAAKNLNDSKKNKNNKDKIAALLGKQGSNFKRAH